MRPALVAVGIALVAVGGALMVLGASNLPGQTLSPGSSYQIRSPEMVPEEFSNYTLSSLGGGLHPVPPLTVAYSASEPLSVWITSCPPPSTVAPSSCIVTSSSHVATNGMLWVNGTLSFPYYLVVQNAGSTGTSPVLTVSIPVTTQIGLPLWEVAIIVGGGVTLAVMGLVSAFLGLFLRSDPYGPSPEPMARDASLPPPDLPSGDDDHPSDTTLSRELMNK